MHDYALDAPNKRGAAAYLWTGVAQRGDDGQVGCVQQCLEVQLLQGLGDDKFQHVLAVFLPKHRSTAIKDASRICLALQYAHRMIPLCNHEQLRSRSVPCLAGRT